MLQFSNKIPAIVIDFRSNWYDLKVQNTHTHTHIKSTLFRSRLFTSDCTPKEILPCEIHNTYLCSQEYWYNNYKTTKSGTVCVVNNELDLYINSNSSGIFPRDCSLESLCPWGISTHVQGHCNICFKATKLTKIPRQILILLFDIETTRVVTSYRAV